MVVTHFQDIFDCINKNQVLSLPIHKENVLKIEFSSSKDNKTIFNGQPPILPFAASDVFKAAVSNCRRLTANDSNCKAIYEITFDISGSNFTFKPGDTIGVIPHNLKSEVDLIIDHFSLKDVEDFNYSLDVKSQAKSAKIPAHIPVNSTLKHVLTHCVDLRCVIKKLFLCALSKYTKDENERKILEYLCSKEGSAVYTSHILNKGICVLDLILMFPSCKPPIEVVLEHLPRLLPRPYSIVNHDHEAKKLKICFSVMDIGNKRKGITTGWLEEVVLKRDNLDVQMDNLSLNEDLKIPIYVRTNMNKFYPQNTEAPLILIGPGTGVAPYIGFLEEREFLHISNPEQNMGYVWLFFGCRYSKLDFIYKKELRHFMNLGTLSKLTTAFSREENSKIRYVQDAIEQNGEKLAELILNGAFVYVCGDIKIMAKQVKDAIAQCLVKHSEKTIEEAESYLSTMQKENRYLIDIWN